MNQDRQDTGEDVEGDRAGRVKTVNDWGEDLQSLTVRHRRGNDAGRQEQQIYYNVMAGDTVGPLNITYTTGFASPFDYWWVKLVTTTGETYTVKDNFYCSISSDDDGNVKLRLDGAAVGMYVSFSKSSGCYVGMSKSFASDNSDAVGGD